MTYSETIQYLYTSAPLFQQQGAGAYKPGLQTTEALDERLGHPHRKFRTIHVAGTNGKGSCAHTIAAVLQLAGYRVGLYTSPHLVDFRERIRVNGEMIPEDAVVAFVEEHRDFFEPLHPSFFELTTAMAFDYFATENVDVAVIEVGLGGRLDCTNIITPDLCLITNISLDHTDLLGDTLAEIAAEKAGIMKPGVPCVIGEALPETRPVFEDFARRVGAPLFFAEEMDNGLEITDYELKGKCQEKNRKTILCALRQLSGLYNFNDGHIKQAFKCVCELTGLRGRWEVISENPRVICDTGHNPGGWGYLSRQLAQIPNLHVVFGMAHDKDVASVLTMLPEDATYYWTQASVRRAMDAEELKAKAHELGRNGESFTTVAKACQAAFANANANDTIFVGGSSFVVADLLNFTK